VLLVLLLAGLLALLLPSVAEASKGSPVTILVQGVDGAAKANVEAAVTLPPGIVRDGLVQQRWLQRFVGQVPELARHALEPFGYYRSEITAELESSGRQQRLLVRIVPGKTVKLRRLDIRLEGDGAEDPALQQARATFPLQPGQPLLHRQYEEGKRALEQLAADHGYLDAEFVTHVINVHPEQNYADIELLLATGPQFRFGPVRFTGDEQRFDEEFLRRFLTFHDGEVFSHRELHRSRVNFYGANRFDEVLVIPHLDQAEDHRVPIEIRLVNAPLQRLRPGIGYGTNTGARCSLSYQNSQVGDTPHLYKFDLSLAEKTQFAETSYTIPQAGGVDNDLILTLGYRQEELATYDSTTIYTEAEETYGLGPGKTGSIFVRYFREESDVGGEDNVAHLFMPGLRYYQRSYDDPLNPKRGYQFRGELRGSHDTLLSDVTLGQVLAGAAAMMPLTRHLSLYTRLEGALTLKDDKLSEIPPSLRFFVGGDNSVRGYAYKSRGPRDSFGDVVGGDSLAVGSMELEYGLNEDWGLAVFYDAGSAFNAFHDIDIIQGAGFGIRRYTPIGPIKLDFANRVSESHHGLRIHFSVGFEI